MGRMADPEGLYRESIEWQRLREKMVEFLYVFAVSADLALSLAKEKDCQCGNISPRSCSSGGHVGTT
jgi:hypothetical protein